MSAARNNASERPGFYFLLCPDAGLALARFDCLIKKCAPAGAAWEKLVFWGDEEPGDRFWGSLGQGGLFSSSRLLVARRAHEWPAAVWKQLDAALGRKNEFAWPFFFLEVDWEKGKPKLPAHIARARCLEFAEKKGWVWKSRGLARSDIRGYVEGEAKRKGLEFSSEALRLFCDSVSPDALGIDNELEKLSLVSEHGEISVDMVAVESASPETDAFACIRRLEDGDLAGAWKELRRGAADSLLFFLVALLAREMRLLWQISNGLAPRIPPDAAARKKTLAKKIGFAGIADGFSALTEAEWNVKSGGMSPSQALDALAVKMAKIFSRRG